MAWCGASDGLRTPRPGHEGGVDDRSRRRRRKLRLQVFVRAVLSMVGLLGAYFLAPLNRDFTASSVFTLVGALVLLVVFVTWQARAIVRSPAPGLRTVEALVTSALLFVIAFSASYLLLSNGAPAGFSERLTHIDALYFTMTVFSSVGFGDIVPRSQAARVLTTVQMAGDLLFVGLAAKVLLEAMRRGVERRERGTRET